MTTNENKHGMPASPPEEGGGSQPTAFSVLTASPPPHPISSCHLVARALQDCVTSTQGSNDRMARKHRGGEGERETGKHVGQHKIYRGVKKKNNDRNSATLTTAAACRKTPFLRAQVGMTSSARCNREARGGGEKGGVMHDEGCDRGFCREAAQRVNTSPSELVVEVKPILT